VIHVAPVGPQVAVLGSVNQPAIIELKAGDTLSAALRLVGGLSSVADTSRVSVETLSDRTSTRVAQVSWPEGGSRPLSGGDVVNVFSVVDTKIPMGKQNKRVVVEGEVQRPGVYVLPAQSSLRDAIAAAGGLTGDAFVFGTQFTRESVRITQQENYDRALRDLEVDLTRNSSTQRASSSDEVKAQEGRADAAQQLVNKLKLVRPNGRVVINMTPTETDLPLMTLEDGDRLYIPSSPTSVGVFGSVFNTGSFVYNGGRTIGDYLAQAGGTTRGADKDSVFLIRANGSVVSNLQSSGWLSDGKLASLAALPGDTVFVPEELNKTTFVQNAKDWTQILYQFALGVAAVNTIK
jgi:protein involved in polysaccharide export with SLBB domain